MKATKQREKLTFILLHRFFNFFLFENIAYEFRTSCSCLTKSTQENQHPLTK